MAIEHFQAVFVNNNFEAKEFGTSDKVLIFEQNRELIISEIEFLQKNATWAKIISLIPRDWNMDSNMKSKIYHYRDEKEIFSILKKSKFHFALVAGVEKSILMSAHETHKQLTLEF